MEARPLGCPWRLVATVLWLLPVGLATADSTSQREPAKGTVTLGVQEIWRVGGDDEVGFGLIGDVTTGSDGNIYVLDSQLSVVRVFSPAGTELPAIGREGEGPGEFRAAMSVVSMADAWIGVAQAFPGKLIGINTDGTPHASLKIPSSRGSGTPVVVRICQNGGNLVVQSLEMDFAGGGRSLDVRATLRSITGAGESGVEYYSAAMTVTPGSRFREDAVATAMPPFAVGSDGRVVVAPHRNRYLLEIHRPDGTLEMVFGRKHESWRRDERARFFALHLARAFMRGFAVYDIELAETEPDIANIHWRTNGEFWVRTGDATFRHPPGEFIFDVFLADGTYDRRVRLDVDADPILDLLVFSGPDRLLLVRGYMDAVLGASKVRRTWKEPGEVEAPTLVCYKIDDR